MNGAINLDTDSLSYTSHLCYGFQAISLWVGRTTDGVSPSLTSCKPWVPRRKTNRSFESGGRGTFMMKKRRMMMTTLTCGWIHTADWPRLAGSPRCFTHVLLSNRVLMASRGINCERRKRKGVVLPGLSVLPLGREPIPSLTFQRSLLLFSQGQILFPAERSYGSEAPGTSVLLPLLHMAQSWLSPQGVNVLHDLTPPRLPCS